MLLELNGGSRWIRSTESVGKANGSLRTLRQSSLYRIRFTSETLLVGIGGAIRRRVRGGIENPPA